jgi:hypothetical protein
MAVWEDLQKPDTHAKMILGVGISALSVKCGGSPNMDTVCEKGPILLSDKI